jgi:hypothetical protein
MADRKRWPYVAGLILVLVAAFVLVAFATAEDANYEEHWPCVPECHST